VTRFMKVLVWLSGSALYVLIGVLFLRVVEAYLGFEGIADESPAHQDRTKGLFVLLWPVWVIITAVSALLEFVGGLM
jgi:hypothetical protein